MRDQYAKKKREMCGRSGHLAPKRRKWKYFDSLSFLSDFIKFENEEEKENEDALLARTSTTPTLLSSAPAPVLQEPKRKEVQRTEKKRKEIP